MTGTPPEQLAKAEASPPGPPLAKARRKTLDRKTLELKAPEVEVLKTLEPEVLETLEAKTLELAT